ncbi:hypothetical protein B0H17DRAFT_1123851 [Mycena rosella]|uniref:Uncharacterized protein n=1 Tax=Mycena rosella TaxID=1033263 RepID=A0AAD7MD60_MYCRO|nr:hypothetical protein B0H17DRAFT_1123851 [Mycena rosella]
MGGLLEDHGSQLEQKEQKERQRCDFHYFFEYCNRNSGLLSQPHQAETGQVPISGKRRDCNWEASQSQVGSDTREEDEGRELVKRAGSGSLEHEPDEGRPGGAGNSKVGPENGIFRDKVMPVVTDQSESRTHSQAGEKDPVPDESAVGEEESQINKILGPLEIDEHLVELVQ